MCGPHSHCGGLAAWSEKEVAQRLDTVLNAMFEVSLPPLVIYRADSAKFSHLLSNDDLVRLLEATFVSIDQWIGLDLLMEGLRYRLSLVAADTISMNELTELESAHLHQMIADAITDFDDPAVVVPVAQTAEHTFDMLSDRQRIVFALRLLQPELTLEDIGSRVHTSKSTVDNELGVVARRLRAMDVTQDEAERVIERLKELCLPYLDPNQQPISELL